jgi:ergothioneine biosynthesis protein EgtB
MHAPSLTSDGPDAAEQARRGDAQTLAAALKDSRADTLASFARFEAALPGLAVPLQPELNPPLWELGHIGWFQEYWIARNPERERGVAADPDAARGAAVRRNGDALYNSSRVAHDLRWRLPLPSAAHTRDDLARQLERSLRCLHDSDARSDEALYFYRLALLHEDMHHEAGLYMAQALGVPIDEPRWQASALPEPPAPLDDTSGTWTLGSESGPGFRFDNECGTQTAEWGATQIDAQVLRWAEFLPFVESGGYAADEAWTAEGRAWREAQRLQAPRYLRHDGSAWAHWRHGRWQPLDLTLPACHLSRHEAEAWCAWAGRRLPTEVEWERAALSHPAQFRKGDVWEWTATPFAPFEGFRVHPYQDYSAPWFDGRPVLRGASFMTQPRMRHLRYRNFFPAHRNDIPAGFRSCAV